MLSFRLRVLDTDIVFTLLVLLLEQSEVESRILLGTTNLKAKIMVFLQTKCITHLNHNFFWQNCTVDKISVFLTRNVIFFKLRSVDTRIMTSARNISCRTKILISLNFSVGYTRMMFFLSEEVHMEIVSCPFLGIITTCTRILSSFGKTIFDTSVA